MNAVTKLWLTREFPTVGFARQLRIPPFHAHLLYNRGIRSPEDAELFLNSDRRLLNDPALLPDMDKAVARLRRALDYDEHIGIFGDFDADGHHWSRPANHRAKGAGRKCDALHPQPR